MPLTCSYETVRTGGDRDRFAHNQRSQVQFLSPLLTENGPRRFLRGPFSCAMGKSWEN